MYAWLVAAAGVSANLLFACMFVARVVTPSWARPLGFAGVAMAIPLTVAAAVAIGSELGAAAVVLPLVFVAFAIGELVVDLVLPFEIRRSRWLWPYLLGFYLAQWAVIGAAFVGSRPGGAAVLVGYFACLAATGWSYRRVGHGSRAQSALEVQSDG